MNKIFIGPVVCFGLLAVFPLAAIRAAGNHWGEQSMVNVDIQFTKPFGTTEVNADGIIYHFLGRSIPENKIYPEQYRGSFPLYFFNLPTSVLVRVSNPGPRAWAKLKIVTESYALRTDGSNGSVMAAPRETEVTIARGETRTIDATFVTYYTPEAESGLDRFIVKVLHVNEGGGPGNEAPSLIMAKEGIYCPPRYTPNQ